MEKLVWRIMIWVLRLWCNRYLDQWERFCLTTEYGPIFVSLDRETPWPESFDRIV